MISSKRTLYLPQSHANTRHSFFKMPSFGLPKILEQTINNILEEYKLASYKIAGNGPRTTIVLRFDANMADASVSPIHQSTPQGWHRRKSPGQNRRDGERLQKQINLSRERIDNQNCSLSRFSEIATKIQVYGDDSALHSQSDLYTATSTRGQAEQKERQQETRPNNPIKLRTNFEENLLDRNSKQPFDSTTSGEAMAEREESTLTMHRSNQNTGLCNSQVDHDDTPTLVSQHISNNVRSPFDTPERRKRASEFADSSRSEQKYSQDAGLTASDTLRTDSSEDNTSNKLNESQHSDIDETFETQHNTPNEESKPEDIQRRVKIRCDKVQSKILFIKKDTRQRITQSERNNKFRKCILDRYNDQCAIVAETDDLIIEYCPRKKAIINLCIKEGEEENQYSRMRKRHLREWPDDTWIIEEELSGCILEFQEQLTQLKHCIAFP